MIILITTIYLICETTFWEYGYACVRVQSLSHVLLFVTPWIVVRQAPLSMGFSRQEHWSGWPFPSPGDLPDPGTEPAPLALQADPLPAEPCRRAPSDTTGGFHKQETRRGQAHREEAV